MQLYKHIIKILIFTFIHDKISADGLIAQLVEQLTLNQLVEGSSPSEPKNKGKVLRYLCFCYRFSGQFGCVFIGYNAELLGL